MLRALTLATIALLPTGEAWACMSKMGDGLPNISLRTIGELAIGVTLATVLALGFKAIFYKRWLDARVYSYLLFAHFLLIGLYATFHGLFLNRGLRYEFHRITRGTIEAILGSSFTGDPPLDGFELFIGVLYFSAYACLLPICAGLIEWHMLKKKRAANDKADILITNISIGLLLAIGAVMSVGSIC